MNKSNHFSLALAFLQRRGYANARHLAQPPLGMSIVAHRGRTALVRSENTIEAFQKAIELGIGQVEFDLRMTRDGRAICYHDPTIDGIAIKDLPYHELLAISKSKGFEIPLFEDILKLCRDRIALDIELKEEGYEAQIIDLTTQYFSYGNFVIKSFNDASVRKVKNLDPQIKVGMLIGRIAPKHPLISILSDFFPEYRIFKTGADFVSPNFRLLKLGFAWRMRLLNREIYVWTVNEEWRLVKLIRNKYISAIITDRPELALKMLSCNNSQEG
jgi:glycerophosphoryl diester phosphodiesterase